MRTLFQTIKQQFLEGNDLVLVSVTASSGSTPRGAGSRMLVGKNGRGKKNEHRITRSIGYS